MCPVRRVLSEPQSKRRRCVYQGIEMAKDAQRACRS